MAKAGLSALSESLIFEARGTRCHGDRFSAGRLSHRLSTGAMQASLWRPSRRTPRAPRPASGAARSRMLAALRSPAHAAARLAPRARCVGSHRAQCASGQFFSGGARARFLRAFWLAAGLRRAVVLARYFGALTRVEDPHPRSHFQHRRRPRRPRARRSPNGAFSFTGTTSTCGSSRCWRSRRCLNRTGVNLYNRIQRRRAVGAQGFSTPSSSC